ncbi:T9SS type A sorting domain-containing protein [Hymenobacter endophyticus]|uniref:T9SS type A sorting domain-containing protein n=1 Tax=Hymenobacter endophyticus TaxID=3076335 RepID=A0ABU3TKB2_9BACT|nr:T9SS type A sorting domain-containing protein [Hymenobacter endophyticus]MDU0371796.1 T9SS type A sorting domain-containing protein [Hymenobacter endophyticus]
MNLARLSSLALGAMLTITSLTSQAQQTGPAARPARAETRAYISRNVLPTLRIQRQKLEAQLSTSDKAQLAVFRAQLHDLRQRGRELRRTTAPGARPALTEPEQQLAQQLRTETRTLLQSVEQLARKYDADIARLAQELKPQREQWATDLQAITAQHPSPATQPRPRKNRRSDGVRRFLQPAQFLLLQPEASTPTPAAPGGNAGLGGVFPNPATAASQLEYEVTKAGPVTVELLDGRGNTLRTVTQAIKQEKGPHTLAVDVADLPTGTYFFKITTRAGAETKRFVKE